MKQYLVPAVGLTGVTALATVLIVLVVLRAVPGMGMIFKPDTHSNLWEEVNPNYDRTPQALVSGSVDELLMVAPAFGIPLLELSQVELGQRLFSTVGCAMCHGLEGQGSVIAPPIAGDSAQLIQAMVRFGPGGMPAFTEDQLGAERLEAIITYLDSIEPVAKLTWVSATPPPDPQPTTSNITINDGAEGATTEDTSAGQALYVSNGCASCHGQNAEGGVGPALAGIIGEQAVDMVRNGDNVMPAFSVDMLSEDDLTAIVTYLQSLTTESPGELGQ